MNDLDKYADIEYWKWVTPLDLEKQLKEQEQKQDEVSASPAKQIDLFSKISK